jgi:hypothetical protein
MSDCIDCGLQSKNTGRPATAKPFGVVEGMFAMAMVADDGTKNGYDFSVAFDQAYLDARLNDADPSKRWYPITDIENFAAPQAEDQFETFQSGNKSLIQKGVRSAEMKIAKTVSKFAGQLQAVGSCGSIGVLMYDECENLRGNTKDAGFLRPMRVADNTWSAILQWAVAGSNAQNTDIMFDFHKSELDKDLGHLTSSTITADIFGAEGLRNVTFTDIVASAASDTITFNARTIFGDASDLDNVAGLEIADLTIIVNAVTLTITDLTQQVGGEYIATVSDDLLLAETGTINGSKNGLEFAEGSITVAA